MLLLILCTVVVAGAIAYTVSKKKQKATIVIETPVEVQPVVVKKELKIKEKPSLKAAPKEKAKSAEKKTSSVKTQNKKAK